MVTDYRRLCIELFGTDDVEMLKKLSKTIKEKNTRNAGRKRKFTADDVKNIKAAVDNGAKINDLAVKYGTSRQVISKYLHAQSKPANGYTLRMTYMYKKTPCTIIDVNFLDQHVLIQNKTDDILQRAFGVNENPTWADFETFLVDRCFPPTRGNIKDILKDLGLTDYDPLQIVEKTQGRTAEDPLWLKFSYHPTKGAVNA